MELAGFVIADDDSEEEVVLPGHPSFEQPWLHSSLTVTIEEDQQREASGLEIEDAEMAPAPVSDGAWKPGENIGPFLSQHRGVAEQGQALLTNLLLNLTKLPQRLNRETHGAAF